MSDCHDFQGSLVPACRPSVTEAVCSFPSTVLGFLFCWKEDRGSRIHARRGILGGVVLKQVFVAKGRTF